MKDARSLSQDAQEALRMKAVDAVRNGMQQKDAAKNFGVTRETICRWMKKSKKGKAALRKKKRGRPREASKLKPWQAAAVVRSIVGKCPDQMRLPFALWTREAVQALIEKNYAVRLSLWTVGRLLKRWGLTPQKPIRRAYERNEKIVKTWLQDEYPAIVKRAKKEKADIHWGDEMGIRSDHQAGTTYGKKGRTPIVFGTGQRFRCNMLSTLTNRGVLRFMLFRENCTNAVFLRFLKRLIKTSPRKVFLIVDRHRAHRATEVKQWLAKHADRIDMFFLPGYSPDLNPDEFLNHDVKSAVGKKRPSSLQNLEHEMRSHLRIRQAEPRIVKRFFHAPTVRYAA